MPMPTLDPAQVTPKQQFRMPRISTRPSVAINQALDDVYAVEQRADYEVRMMMWHDQLPSAPGNTERCGVCLGGAMLARTNGYNPDLELTPDHVETDDERRVVVAMDSIRELTPELVQDGLAQLYVPAHIAREAIQAALPRNGEGLLPTYDEDPVAFKTQRRKLASELLKRGY